MNCIREQNDANLLTNDRTTICLLIWFNHLPVLNLYIFIRKGSIIEFFFNRYMNYIREQNDTYRPTNDREKNSLTNLGRSLFYDLPVSTLIL